MSEVLPSPQTLKACCAAVYQSDWIRWLLGGSFHPGGTALTERLGNMIAIDSRDRMLDVACGRGDSALHLARVFGCAVIGVDYGKENVEFANAAAATAGLAQSVQFQRGDAESLGFPDSSFSVVICECAFCTFPGKDKAAREFMRVLRPGGRLGLSDLTRVGPLPPELETPVAWIGCIADAQSLKSYVGYAEQSGLQVVDTEDHRSALLEMVTQIRLRLAGGQIVANIQGIELDGVDLEQATVMARKAAEAIESGILSYALMTAVRPMEGS
jgi:arsenite methyltransferase